LTEKKKGREANGKTEKLRQGKRECHIAIAYHISEGGQDLLWGNGMGAKMESCFIILIPNSLLGTVMFHLETKSASSTPPKVSAEYMYNLYFPGAAETDATFPPGEVLRPGLDVDVPSQERGVFSLLGRKGVAPDQRGAWASLPNPGEG
jgi:hypothetical protein